MVLRVSGIQTVDFLKLCEGGEDANGQRPQIRKAEGVANPCRHCLELIAPGDDKLVLSYRPFRRLQPYAETGPIFLHSKACHRYESDVLPAWFRFLDTAAIRGYDAEDSIRYDTGQIVRGAELGDACVSILNDYTIAYVHIRSKFGCFQCRVDRA